MCFTFECLELKNGKINKASSSEATQRALLYNLVERLVEQVGNMPDVPIILALWLTLVILPITLLVVVVVLIQPVRLFKVGLDAVRQCL